MLFKIRDIGEEGIDLQIPLTAAWLAAEAPDLDAKPGRKLAVTGRLERSGESFLLRARLKGALTTACARCLEPAEVAIDVPMVLSYEETDGKDADDEDAENADEPDVLQFSGGAIDLGPAIRDELLLAMPIGPLCKEDCAGICPQCGANRNINPCDCLERQRQAQSKFSVLAKLKQ